MAHAIWGHLLKLYPAATVAPFSLLVPIFGLAFASMLLGERLSPLRLAGIALVLVGVTVVALPVLPQRLWRPGAQTGS